MNGSKLLLDNLVEIEKLKVFVKGLRKYTLDLYGLMETDPPQKRDEIDEKFSTLLYSMGEIIETIEKNTWEIIEPDRVNELQN